MFTSCSPGEEEPQVNCDGCLRYRNRKYLLLSQFWSFRSETGLIHLLRGNQVGALLLRHTPSSFPGVTVSGTLMVVGKAPWLRLPATRSAPKLSGRFKNNAKPEVSLGLDPLYRTFRTDKVKRIKPSQDPPRMISIWPVVTLMTYVSAKV